MLATESTNQDKEWQTSQAANMKHRSFYQYSGMHIWVRMYRNSQKQSYNERKCFGKNCGKYWIETFAMLHIYRSRASYSYLCICSLVQRRKVKVKVYMYSPNIPVTSKLYIDYLQILERTLSQFLLHIYVYTGYIDSAGIYWYFPLSKTVSQ